MGATGYAYELAKQFGLKVVPPRPALVPFTFDPGVLEKLKPLSGVSTEAVVSCGKTSFREALLFTHRGLSGPAVLQISSYWRPGDEIVVDLLPGRDAFALLREARGETPKVELHNLLSEWLPRRLAAMLCAEAGALLGIGGRLADLSDKKLRAVADLLNRWRLKPGGTEGYRTAEVTAGGVDTEEISSKTFEAKKRARPLLHRRVPRRHWLAWRLQFPVGLGLRSRGGAGGVRARITALPLAAGGAIRDTPARSPI
jgi:predicted Rossmann fold flavoprotein